MKLYLKIKCEEAQIILLLAGSIVWNILDNNFDSVYVCVDLVFVEEGGEEAEEGQTGQYRHGVGCQGIGPGQRCVHFTRASILSEIVLVWISIGGEIFGQYFQQSYEQDSVVIYPPAC